MGNTDRKLIFHAFKMPQAEFLPSSGKMCFGAVGAPELRGIGEKSIMLRATFMCNSNFLLIIFSC